MADQSIIVTGGGSGIGLSIVKLLLLDPRVGLVVAVDIQTSQLDELAAKDPSKLHVVKGDVSQRQTSEDAVQVAVSRSGHLDTIILNAGILGPVSPITEGDVDDWKRLFDVNFFGPLHGTKSWGAYSCGKAALNHLCWSLAYEEPSISTVSVTPGIVDTAIQKLVRDEHKDTLDPETYRFLDGLHQQGKMLHPDQPASAFVKLALDGIPQDIQGRTVAWDDSHIQTA